ncbi:amino acid adenylation domain-containing protein [Streptomyces sp. UNOC14_S4]|uniref:amino acid adenylation domain-containing protein n=1 Tax=Streptomyces sp. UNOC14_S4 TaxID=2872340 RepID=UPI001E557942|nr:amino acid adenylation domain-containing protein [Streptomyces sp. UNOC14_S4]MCC3766837.1 amino acid adenylation domain-containing protein [Streptomyces sp. UNOC14_S4]
MSDTTGIADVTDSTHTSDSTHTTHTADIRLDALLAASARRHPDRPALIAEGRTWTYTELDDAVGALARQLTAAGLAPGDRVGVYAAKGTAAVLGIYAGLRAGAVVAPLDVADPPARTAHMVRGGGISLLLAADRALPGARRAAAEAGAPEPAEGSLDHGLNRLRTLPPTAGPSPLPAPTDRGGYVLFTSGSTGRPKGVLLSHANVAHFAVWAAAELGLTEADRVGSQAALTFDLTTFDLFSTAAVGACAVLMPDVLRSFPRDVVDWLAEQRITAFYAVPSLWQGMLEQGGIAERFPAALRVAAFAGEPFAPRPLERYLRLLGDVPFYNLYGPTETNVCTYSRVPADWTADQEITIGRAVPGDAVDVLDEDGKPTDGLGEIHVAGTTVFQGYLQDGGLVDPTRTAVFRDGVARRAYATGDLGRIAEDGRVFLRGRADSQVKRRGHRIDLLDVEAAVLGLPRVTAAAVVAKDGPHHGEIWAYVLADAPEAELLAGLRGTLPLRMLPDRVVVTGTLPVNARGKVDRRALATET